MKQRHGYMIALSGISAALAVISLMGALFIPVGKLAFYTLSALFVALPLTKNLISGGIFTYIVAGIISFFVSNIKSFPFIFFFGLYSIVAFLLDFKLYKVEKLPKVAKIIIIVIAKICFFIMAFFTCYKLMGLVVSDIVLGSFHFTLPLLTIVAYIMFSLYDILYRYVFKVMTMKIDRIIKTQ